MKKVLQSAKGFLLSWILVVSDVKYCNSVTVGCQRCRGASVSLACALKNRVFKAAEIIYEHSLLAKVNNNSKNETVRLLYVIF